MDMDLIPWEPDIYIRTHYRREKKMLLPGRDFFTWLLPRCWIRQSLLAASFLRSLNVIWWREDINESVSDRFRPDEGKSVPCRGLDEVRGSIYIYLA